jgi:CheY-like chemotaxis protein
MSKDAFLMVDDEAIILLALKKELRDHFGDRYRYETALSGAEALELVDVLVEDGIRIVLIISDWLMPGITGGELLIRLKSKYPGIAAILVTGHADSTAIERVRMAAGLKACILKPWSRRELFDAVESCLSR